MIYRFYRYYFYRVWLWELNKNGGDFGTPFKTWYATCVLMFLNFGDLLLIVDILYHSVFNIDITIGQYFGVTMFIMMGILIPLLSYFLFVYKKKYRKFIDKFKDESPKQKNRNLILIGIYYGISVLWIVFGVMIGRYFRDKATWYENEEPVKQEIVIPINIDTAKIDDYERFSGYDTLEQDELNEIMKQYKKK